MTKDPKSVGHSVADKGLVKWEALPFLDKVVAIMPSIVYVYNQKQQASEYSNRSLGESIGYEPEEVQAMGDSFMPQVCHPDDLPRVFAHFQKLRDIKDGEVCMLEYRMRRKDGG